MPVSVLLIASIIVIIVIIKKEIIKEEEQSNKQSIYALRTKENELNGYAYQFLPSPFYFNKNVTRIFDKSIYTMGEIDYLSLFKLNETDIFNNCKYYVSDSKTYEVQSDKNNTIEFKGLTYNIPRGAVDMNTNIAINLLYFYDCYCNNGVKDNDEEGVDCGEECVKSCGPTCYDETQNGNETGIDCGGECFSCDYVENYTPNPSCQAAEDCSGFCGSMKPLCLFNTCFCTSSCGNKKCESHEAFFRICEEDCPACDNVGDLDEDCKISFSEVFQMIRRWFAGEVVLENIINSINLWLRS